jgi:hypothetical protein
MPAIEKDNRPAVSRMKDNEVIQQSEAQINSRLARPEDFVVLSPEEGITAETPGHGQQGKTAAERRKLMKTAADAPGKSKLSI